MCFTVFIIFPNPPLHAFRISLPVWKQTILLLFLSIRMESIPGMINQIHNHCTSHFLFFSSLLPWQMRIFYPTRNCFFDILTLTGFVAIKIALLLSIITFLPDISRNNRRKAPGRDSPVHIPVAQLRIACLLLSWNLEILLTLIKGRIIIHIFNKQAIDYCSVTIKKKDVTEPGSVFLPSFHQK